MAPPTDRLVLYRDSTSSPGSVQLSDSNELPASQPAHFREKDVRTSNQRGQVPCPKFGSRVQRRYLRRHDKNMHQGGRRWIHFCPYCSGDKVKMYSTFVDWRNHPSDTHHTRMEEGDPLLQAEYAAGFKLDGWGRLHELDGSDTKLVYASSPSWSDTAGTKARLRDSRRDHRPPSASRTPKVARPTETQPPRNLNWWGLSAEGQA